MFCCGSSNTGTNLNSSIKAKGLRQRTPDLVNKKPSLMEIKYYALNSQKASSAEEDENRKKAFLENQVIRWVKVADNPPKDTISSNMIKVTIKDTSALISKDNPRHIQRLRLSEAKDLVCQGLNFETFTSISKSSQPDQLILNDISSLSEIVLNSSTEKVVDSLNTAHRSRIFINRNLQLSKLQKQA